jgi:hypothetical protein
MSISSQNLKEILEAFKSQCKVAREVVGGPRGPIVIIVEVIQCKVD